MDEKKLKEKRKKGFFISFQVGLGHYGPEGRYHDTEGIIPGVLESTIFLHGEQNKERKLAHHLTRNQ